MICPRCRESLQSMRGARGERAARARSIVRGGEVRARPLHSVECRVCSVCDLREADIDEGPMWALIVR